MSFSINPYQNSSSSSFNDSALVYENNFYAIAVTLMRPSKLKFKVGNFTDFSPSERIYSRHCQLIKLGASDNNYADTVSTSFFVPPGGWLVFPTGQTLRPLNSAANMSYVTETDVLAVTNAKATYFKMMSYLHRQSSMTLFQTEVLSPPKTGSTPTSISPGSNGSMLMFMGGQGYEFDFRGTADLATYTFAHPAGKHAMDDGASANEWGHSWWGTQPLMMPFADTMDGMSWTFDIRVYSSHTTYAGQGNVQIVELPSDWNTDVS